jgi:uncharacterized membrane protein YfhO
VHANHLFMGIHVPDGEHTVLLEYRPTAIPVGIGATTGALVTVGLIVLVVGLRRARPTARSLES